MSEPATLDFTTALYLGMHHASPTLKTWKSLTTGRPDALGTGSHRHRVAASLAKLSGCETARLAPSTLHLGWDLFGMLSPSRWAVYVDGGAYPIARGAAERALARGVAVRSLPHYDVRALERALARGRPSNRRPLVVADGFCPGCGRSVPLAPYVERLAASDGMLVLDDTQALGILGRRWEGCAPYGFGGGGTLRRQGLRPRCVLLVSSLAKAFGVPIAVLAGPRRLVDEFHCRSETHVHSSGPSTAAVHAAERALSLNGLEGEERRRHLARCVREFRARLSSAGLGASGGSFPVQTLRGAGEARMRAVHQRLHEHGVRTVLHRSGPRGQASLSFLFTALHRPQQIERAVETLIESWPRGSGTGLPRSLENDHVCVGYGCRAG